MKQIIIENITIAEANETAFQEKSDSRWLQSYNKNEQPCHEKQDKWDKH